MSLLFDNMNNVAWVHVHNIHVYGNIDHVQIAKSGG